MRQEFKHLVVCSARRSVPAGSPGCVCLNVSLDYLLDVPTPERLRAWARSEVGDRLIPWPLESQQQSVSDVLEALADALEETC